MDADEVAAPMYQATGRSSRKIPVALDTELSMGACSAAASLLQRIADAYPRLSPRSRHIADDIVRNVETFGLDLIGDVARRCSVSESAVVQFARRFGFSGFREMRKIFRDQSCGRAEGRCAPHESTRLAWSALLKTRMRHTRETLTNWHQSNDYDAIGRASGILALACSIRIACTALALPAGYLCLHALLRKGIPCELILPEWLDSMRVHSCPTRDSVWLAISLGLDAPALGRITGAMTAAGEQTIFVTDNSTLLGAGLACETLTVPSPCGLDFDSLTATIALCEALLHGTLTP